MAVELSDAELALLHSLFDAARDGRTSELTAALDAGVPVDLTNAAGDTLLVLAAYHGHGDTVDALLARGAAVERVNDRGQTALGAAVFKQSAPVVRSLVAAGADPDLGGRTAREIANFFELHEMTALLPPG